MNARPVGPRRQNSGASCKSYPWALREKKSACRFFFGDEVFSPATALTWVQNFRQTPHKSYRRGLKEGPKAAPFAPNDDYCIRGLRS